MDIRKALLKPQLKQEAVLLPSLGEEVVVQEMNAVRLELYESLLYSVGEEGKVSSHSENIKAKIAVCSVVNEQGELLFKADDVHLLSQSYGRDLRLIAEVGARLSGLYSAERVEKN